MRPLILIPCKSLATGKSRLSSVLSAAQRQALCRRFFVDTLALAATQVARHDIRVVSPDEAVARIAAELGIGCMVDDGADLNSALTDAAAAMTAAGPGLAGRDVLVLPIDLARATPQSVARVLAAPDDLVLAPDLQERGTNLLRLPGAAAQWFRFQFGDDSFSLHLAEAERLHLGVRILRDPALGFDVDSPNDYAAWVAGRGSTQVR